MGKGCWIIEMSFDVLDRLGIWKGAGRRNLHLPSIICDLRSKGNSHSIQIS